MALEDMKARHPVPKVAFALAVARGTEQQIADSFALLADRHSREADVRDQGTLMSAWSARHVAELEPAIEKYGKTVSERPERLRAALFGGTRVGSLGLLMDLKDMCVLVQEQQLTWTALNEAGQELRDEELIKLVKKSGEETTKQLEWLKTRFKETSGTALTIMPDPKTELEASIPKHLSVVAIPDPVWGPVAVALLTLAVGVPAILVGFQPWLLPSLGPTAFLQAALPAHPTARLWNVLLGHGGGVLAGFAGVALFNAWNDPVVLTDHTLSVGRLGASVVAMALLMLIGGLLRASHPPAAATVLLITLGSVTDQTQLIAFAIGLAILAVAGELLRRLRLGGMSWGAGKAKDRLETARSQ